MCFKKHGLMHAININNNFEGKRTMKIRIIKGKSKGTRGKVVGVYTDGRYDINVTNRKPNQPKQMVVKMTMCEEVR